MASAQVLSLRAVNRALLARQLLLERQALPAGQPDRAARVVQTIEHLVGLRPRRRSRRITGCTPAWTGSAPRTWPR